jgi:DNA-3-methyladenine glycosylase
MKFKIKKLNLAFFRRPALDLAPDLLGKYLVRRTSEGEISSAITEVEAYAGIKDRASHSFKGLTPRTKALFQNGGIWYVYFVYGKHFMLNVVAGSAGDGEAVLIRSVEAARGPGRVAKFFRVSADDYGQPVNSNHSLRLEDRGLAIDKKHIKRAARVGIDYAGPIWSRKKYNFSLPKFDFGK